MVQLIWSTLINATRHFARGMVTYKKLKLHRIQNAGATSKAYQAHIVAATYLILYFQGLVIILHTHLE